MESRVRHVIDRYFSMQEEYFASVAGVYGLQPDDVKPLQHALDGALKLVDAVFLDDQLQALRPRRILELGSFLGFSTRWILDASADWDASVVSVDPGLRHRVFDQPRRHLRQFCAGSEHRLRLLDGCVSSKNEAMFMHDYLMYEPRLNPREALARMDVVPVLSEPFGTFDFAFVDGDHGYDATLANVALVARMMPGGGTIVVHDAFSFPDVVPALEAACAASPALAFAGVDGTSFHLACDRIARLTGRDPGSIKAPLSDGMGVVRVSAPAASMPANEEAATHGG